MSRSLPALAALSLVLLLATLLSAQEQVDNPRRTGFFDRLEELRRSLMGEEPNEEGVPATMPPRGGRRSPMYTAGRDRRIPASAVPAPSPRGSSRRRAALAGETPGLPARRLPPAPRQAAAVPPSSPLQGDESPEELWPDDVSYADQEQAEPLSDSLPQGEAGADQQQASEASATPQDGVARRPSSGAASTVPRYARAARAAVPRVARLDGPDSPPAAPGVRASQSEASAAGPVIRATVKGPKKLVLGHAATYLVEVHNEGQSPALQLVVTVSLPEWGSVQRSQASLGQPPLAVDGGLEWRIERLQPGSSAQLELDLVPRQRRPIELGVQWTCAAATSQLSVEVHEPRLQLSLAGARQVEFGSKQVYTLTLLNSGDGDATEVGIQLLPLAAGDPPPGTYKVGTLPAGASKTVELELLARQSGTVEIRAVARSAEGLEAQLSEVVEVLRPQLEIEVAGPAHQFALTPATYHIRLRNQGNATARKVRVSAILPPRGEFLSSGGDAEASQQDHELVWNLASLPPGAEKVLTLQCLLSVPGECRVELTAEAEHGVRATASHATRVTALADLVLDLADPKGPVPVGETAVYELRIANRGAASAENVQVVAYFSNGLEPLAAEGSRHEIATGTVQFLPIRSLAAGQELVLRIQARAETAGSHKVRVELTSPAPETSLVVEESTLFYAAE